MLGEFFVLTRLAILAEIYFFITFAHGLPPLHAGLAEILTLKQSSIPVLKEIQITVMLGNDDLILAFRGLESIVDKDVAMLLSGNEFKLHFYSPSHAYTCTILWLQQIKRYEASS
jgi:hypothetical protein